MGGAGGGKEEEKDREGKERDFNVGSQFIDLKKNDYYYYILQGYWR